METRLVTKAGHTDAGGGRNRGRDGEEKKREMCPGCEHAERRGQEREKARGLN